MLCTLFVIWVFTLYLSEYVGAYDCWLLILRHFGHLAMDIQKVKSHVTHWGTSMFPYVGFSTLSSSFYFYSFAIIDHKSCKFSITPLNNPSSNFCTIPWLFCWPPITAAYLVYLLRKSWCPCILVLLSLMWCVIHLVLFYTLSTFWTSSSLANWFSLFSWHISFYWECSFRINDGNDGQS